jgi:hypothetical protein
MSFSLCSLSNANTGLIDCDISRGVLKQLFIFNGEIAEADYADTDTLLAQLVENSKLSKSAANKIFPLPEVQEVSDKSEANKEGSLGLGFKTVLLEGKPAYEMKVFAGSTLAKAMRKFNNQTVGILEYDANGRVWGTKSGTDFTGFQAKIFVTSPKMATGQNVEEGISVITVSFLSTSEYNDNAYYMPIDGNIADVVGLLDVKSTYVSNVANVHKVKFTVPTSQIGGEINLGDLFPSDLADAALFSAKTGATYGTTLAITSVTYDSATKSYVFTFDSTAYTALTIGDKIKLIPDGPEILDAADVTGVEIEFIILTKEA